MNPCFRLGAAKAMAYCARKLRGEPDLVGQYLLECLGQCVRALRLAEDDAEGAKTKGVIGDAIRVRRPGALESVLGFKIGLVINCQLVYPDPVSGTRKDSITQADMISTKGSYEGRGAIGLGILSVLSHLHVTAWLQMWKPLGKARSSTNGLRLRAAKV